MLRLMMRRVLIVLCLIMVIATTNLFPASKGYAAALTVTSSGTNIIINTGSGLVYTIDQYGNLTSAKMNCIELNGSKASQINSGVAGTVSWNLLNSGSTVLITVANDSFTHYYVSRAGENIIYMADNIVTSYGEFRYIFRGDSSILTNMPAESNNNGTTGAIESQDVFGYADGHTTSKYYGNDQAKDLSIRGVTGNGVGVFMAYGNREKSSGGPFFRDIQTQGAELYNYMYSGHEQTEAMRLGLHGPYAYIFTTGETPSYPNLSWMSSLNLQGWVSDSTRGRVILNGLNGRVSGYPYTIGFANSNAQYWYTPSASGGTSMYGIIPGTYTMTVYKGELAVYTENVTVNAGSPTTLNTRTITGDPSATSAIWRIGNWDGTPNEFLNGLTISHRHPSDSRNLSWSPVSYTVGSVASMFPAIQFRGKNSPTTVNFSLNATHAAASHVLKIGITTALYNGRPSVTINGHGLTNPGPSSQPDSRSFTIGTYRGNNTTFSWTIPSSYLVNGTNTLTITPISGSSDLSPWLSAGWVYDCVELAN